MNPHLIVAPILIPLAAAAAMLLLPARHRRWESAIAIASCGLLLVTAAALAVAADTGGGAGVAYRLGNWPAWVAIVLVSDRLSALMLLLAAGLGLATSVFAAGRWSSLGPFFHPLSQFLLMGLNGAFLTGDLFNLFVFFEVLLAASYGLLLHGSGPERVKAGLHYIVVNLVASLLFLIGVSLIFGVTGTLNMAMLAERVASAPPDTRGLLHAGAAVLGVAFLVKAAAWPMGFWLPGAYDAAAAPVAAMFAIMTKVGVYAILRLGLLLFGAGAGGFQGFGATWLLAAGALTILTGLAGMLAVRDLGRLGGYNLVVSAGTLLAASAFENPAVTAGALFYLVVSTIGAAALFLFTGLISGERGDAFAEPPRLEAYDPADEGAYTEEDERAVVIAAPVGILSAAFLGVTLTVAGIPPLPGFLAKAAMLSPLTGEVQTWPSILLITLLISSSLLALIALMRAGMQIWWVDDNSAPPTLRVVEIVPVAGLLALLLAMTVLAQGPLGYAQRTAAQLHTSSNYVNAVLSR
ncbi:monovalent cation/H+ antiporter subunit D [Phenylobacterium sp. LjRoot164]|uniref:monovalent cation/H+ antiporter subunit D n=1 Tax=unclassified Phenylobacterium TaxID=2640670 RepID=UPI003ECF3187